MITSYTECIVSDNCCLASLYKLIKKTCPMWFMIQHIQSSGMVRRTQDSNKSNFPLTQVIDLHLSDFEMGIPGPPSYDLKNSTFPSVSLTCVSCFNVSVTPKLFLKTLFLTWATKINCSGKYMGQMKTN